MDISIASTGATPVFKFGSVRGTKDFLTFALSGTGAATIKWALDEAKTVEMDVPGGSLDATNNMWNGYIPDNVYVWLNVTGADASGVVRVG